MRVQKVQSSPARGIRLVALSCAMALVAAACGGGDADDGTANNDGGLGSETILESAEPEPQPAETTTTAPATTTEAPVEEPTTEAPAEETTTTVAEAETEAPAPSGDAGASLSAASGLPELQAVVGSLAGPTDDVSAVARRTGTFPDVPTMVDASVIGIQAEMYRFGEENLQHSNRIEYWTPLSIGEAMAAHETDLTALGYEVAGGSTQSNSDGSESGLMEVDLPDEGDRFSQSLRFTFRSSADYEGTKVEIWFQAGDVWADQLALHGTWHFTRPLPPDGEHRGVKVTLTPVGDPQAPDRFWANSSAHWYFQGTSDAIARAEVGTILADSDDYALDGDLETFSVSLSSTLFEKGATLVFQESGDNTIIELMGKWDVPAAG